VLYYQHYSKLIFKNSFFLLDLLFGLV